ncbi:cupin domain-containing protein [Arenimonas terrae]|uniref:Cupin domain-containing protein n=1 Tax=Arenimonas terrae TaxID=2546226 RepID=A0A5C4RQS6_9GAMM|nr:cupin domain-containing protein [Arenimonas terrae]
MGRANITWCALLLASFAAAGDAADGGGKRRDSHVQNEAGLAVRQPGPHDGEGTSTAYPFFDDAEDFRVVFRKRALHKGATIGLHTNDKDEIYYVLSGRGELTLEGEVSEVGPGDAILTRDGDSHGLRQLGDEDLVILVVFPKRPGDP